MKLLLWIILFTFLDGLLGLAGVFTLLFSKKLLKRLLFALVAFSAGALLAGGLIHLLGESLENLSSTTAFSVLLGGFVLFFLIERILHWHHCHEGECDVHAFSYLILFGDSVHNFLDGIVIAASFLVSINFGIVTSLLIMGHELPQEIGNFGVLVYGGISRLRSLIYNFAVQLTAIVGGIVGFFLSSSVQQIVPYALAFAAGGFVYIAASDLVPELHKEPDIKKSLGSFGMFIVGIAFMWGLKLAFAG